MQWLLLGRLNDSDLLRAVRCNTQFNTWLAWRAGYVCHVWLASTMGIGYNGIG